MTQDRRPEDVAQTDQHHLNFEYKTIETIQFEGYETLKWYAAASTTQPLQQKQQQE